MKTIVSNTGLGIAWFAVEGIPIFLEIIGLGIASHGFEAR